MSQHRIRMRDVQYSRTDVDTTVRTAVSSFVLHGRRHNSELINRKWLFYLRKSKKNILQACSIPVQHLKWTLNASGRMMISAIESGQLESTLTTTSSRTRPTSPPSPTRLSSTPGSTRSRTWPGTCNSNLSLFSVFFKGHKLEILVAEFFTQSKPIRVELGNKLNIDV